MTNVMILKMKNINFLIAQFMKLELKNLFPFQMESVAFHTTIDKIIFIVNPNKFLQMKKWNIFFIFDKGLMAAMLNKEQ